LRVKPVFPAQPNVEIFVRIFLFLFARKTVKAVMFLRALFFISNKENLLADSFGRNFWERKTAKEKCGPRVAGRKNIPISLWLY
jgi:hypothetical protein